MDRSVRELPADQLEKGTMIVDVHTMAGGYFIRKDPMGFPELFAAMEKTGVDLAAVLSLRALHADARKGNDFLFSMAATDPRIIPIGVVTPNVSSLDVPDVVADCVKNGAAGLALFMGNRSVTPSALPFRRTLAEAARPGLPLIATGIPDGGMPTQLAEMTRDLGCPILLTATYYGLLDEILAVLEEFDHVYADTGWHSTPGCIELLVKHGGPGRILFGSGAPIRPIQPALNMILDADVGEDAKRKILAGNALRLFGREADAERVESSQVPLPEPRFPSVPAIDIHCHFGVHSEITTSRRDLEAIEYYVERSNIEYAICNGPVAYREDLDGGNHEMLEKIDGRPRLLGSPVISPTHLEKSVRWLDLAAKHDRLVQVTLNPDYEGEAFGSEAYMALWEETAKRGIPVLYNSGSQDIGRTQRWERKMGRDPWIRGGSRDEIEMFLEVGRRHPDLPIIFGHGMGEDGVRLSQRTKNVYLDLSGTYPEGNPVRAAIDGAGKDRVVFGTDLDLTYQPLRWVSTTRPGCRRRKSVLSWRRTRGGFTPFRARSASDATTIRWHSVGS